MFGNTNLLTYDFTISVFLTQYSHLQQEYHQQDKNSLTRKIGRYVTIEQKINFLNDELERQQDFFDESEYFEISEELSDTIFSELIEKLKKIAPDIKQTSRWKELNNDQKGFFQALINLPNDFINPQNLSPQKIRSKINQTPALYKTYKSISKQEQGKSTISSILLNIVSDIFYLHFQSKLNQILKEEYQKLIPKSDYELAVIVNEEQQEEESSRKKITIALPKVERSANDKITSLTLDQTTYLFSLLREQGIVLKEKNYQSVSNIALAIRILTGYNDQNIRVKIDKKDSIDRLDKFVVQEKIKKINVLITKELN